MALLFQNIKNRFFNLNLIEKIIAVNVVVFIIGLIFKPNMIWLELPSEIFDLIIKPWTIITYMFLHYDFFHILFNMLWLYFLARLFLNLFGTKTALNVYFLGAIFGGLMFTLCYTLLPNFFGNHSSLIGASAAVRALLIFLCAYMPYQETDFFTFKLKLWWVGAVIVVLDIFGLFGANAGGNLAHIGGALLGYIYAIQLKKGHDIGKGFERFMDAIINLFKPAKKGPLKTVYKNKSKVGGYTKSDFNQFNNQKKIDVILDKISKSGYDSLTSEEKEFLFRAGK